MVPAYRCIKVVSSTTIEQQTMHPDIHTKSRLAYGINDALAVVPVGRSLLYQEIKAGNLRTFKIGNRTLIASDDLSAWLESHRRAAAA